jgi:ligand-binding SRPBCC domain-containing protein
MTTLTYEIDVNAPVEMVYNFCTNPDNIKNTWPPDIVKESTTLSGAKGEKGSTFKIKGHYAGKDEEMRMMVTESRPNNKFMTKQTEGPFKKWESIQEFQGGDNKTHIKHTIDYELPATGKILRIVTHKDADKKIREGMEEYIQALKYEMESSERK